MLLEKINSPRDLKKLDSPQLMKLAGEIREEILKTVSANGGHLAPSLGAVELTLAIHTVFDSPRDKVIWDVGHQSYAHKLVTGRREDFHTLRRSGGISGFPKRSESEHDAFDTGHASTSISAALGMAKARDLSGKKYSVIAVIGDGSMTGGMAFEALDHAGHDKTDLIVVLNDNRMSIAPNVGAISNYLTRLRTDPAYNRAKADIEEALRRIPRIGRSVAHAMEKFKDGIKHLLVPGQLFEDLGFNYYGPIDGHDIKLIQSTLRSARAKGGPVIVHVVTQKGRGYSYAEDSPDKFHGGGPFDLGTGNRIHSPALTYTDVFSRCLCDLAEKDPRIVAITAAMPDGTGLSRFAEKFPERFFDVGIAEEHAVTFAAGLATQGFRPVVAIYSTFMQRAVDQVIHDVCLPNLSVVFALDRAGIVGDDGETHQGVFDFANYRPVPGLSILAPKDERELARMLYASLAVTRGPVMIRYPRGKGPGTLIDSVDSSLPWGQGEILRRGNGPAVLAIGSVVDEATRAARELEKEGLFLTVANARFVKPLDTALIDEILAAGFPLVTVEDHARLGGFGSAVVQYLADSGRLVRVQCLGLPDQFIPHGTIPELRARYGIDAAGIARAAREIMKSSQKVTGSVLPIARGLRGRNQ